jgi:acyl-coenzyme A synthetase/AMP-(fatty) acid ligase
MLRQSLCYQAELLLQRASGKQGEQVLQLRPAVALLAVVLLAVAVAGVLAQVLTVGLT